MKRKFTKSPILASNSMGNIDVDRFEEMISEEDYSKILYCAKDKVDEYYSGSNYVVTVHGGQAGVVSVRQLSGSEYDVTVEVDVDVSYDDGTSGTEYGKVVVSYNSKTSEMSTSDVSEEVEASTSVVASKLQYPREECDTDYVQLYYDGKKYTAMGEIVVGQGATLQEAVNDAIEDASNYDSSMYDDMTYVDKVDYTEADVDDLGVLEVFWHFVD